MSKIKLPKDGSFPIALKAFQKGDIGANAWIVFGYEGKARLIIVASGEGGVDELREHFLPGICSYGLIRKEWKIELANTTKFAFISWRPTGLKPMRKAMLSIHNPQVKDLLAPTHVQLEAEELS